MNSCEEYLLIIGATSDIGVALAHRYASAGFHLHLTARNTCDLDKTKHELSRYSDINVEMHELDILNVDAHKIFFESLMPKPGGVIFVTGLLGVQQEAENYFDHARLIMETNLVAPTSLLEIIAADFSTRRRGFIVGISSVAGDRGRKSNYIYGSAKAGFSAYLSGLRNRLHNSDVQVLTVKPGFVATKMTKDMHLPKVLTTTPERVAQDIFCAQQQKKSIIYTAWYWKYVMAIIKILPEGIFKRMSL